MTGKPIQKENKHLWSDGAKQKEVLQQFSDLVEETEPWFILLVGPSVLLGSAENHENRKAPIKVNESLWGNTDPSYGEHIARFIKQHGWNVDRLFKGMIFEMLKDNPELKKFVLKALLKESVDGKPLEKQDLYDRVVS